MSREIYRLEGELAVVGPGDGEPVNVGELVELGARRVFVHAGVAVDGFAGEGEPHWRLPLRACGRHDSRHVLIVLLGYDTEGACKPWKNATTAKALAEGLAIYGRAVGIAWHSSVGATAESLIRQSHPPERGGSALGRVEHVPAPARVGGLERPYDQWRRRLLPSEARSRYLHAFDMRAQYLAAWSTTELPIGEPEYVTDTRFDRKRPGLWRLERMPGDEGLGVLLPDPWTPGQEWFTTPTLERVGELVEVPPVAEAWIWPESRRYLEPAYRRLRDARSRLLTFPAGSIGAAALDAVKAVYRVGTGRLGWGARAESGSRWDRPHWAHFVRAKARANLDRRLYKLDRAPFAIATDALYFLDDEPDAELFAKRIGLPLGPELGQFGHVATIPAADVAERLEKANNATKVARLVREARGAR